MLQLATKEFAFEPELLVAARHQLFNASKEHLKNKEMKKKIMFVSVHVRRTDYKLWLSKRVEGQLVSRCQFHQRSTYSFYTRRS